MTTAQPAASRSGLLFGLAAYGLWGLMPIYFRAIEGVSAIELLAHRILWSVVLLALILTVLRRWPAFWRCLGHPRTRTLLLGSTFLIAANWYVFIYGVETGQIVQNSLGYFINPLLNVLLGVAVFGERLRRAQWAALALAALGVGYLIVVLWVVPWIALTLATSFALYGLLRKVAPVDTLVGLTVETAFLAPVAGGFLVYWWASGDLALGSSGPRTDTLLLASGVVTTVPLLCFGAAARRLPLSTLGFLQYLAPSLQLCLGVFAYGERFGPAERVAFTLIWSALAIVTIDQAAARSRRKPAPPREVRESQPEASGAA